jgi:hypothetical protein
MKLPERDELINLLATNSFRLGEFTLSSGLKSDYYIDCRTTTLHARGAELTGRVFLDLFRQEGWRPRAAGGLTMGADPVVVAISVISSQAGTPVHGFLVRKQEKAHGMGRRIEGFQEKGAPVVIVDDVSRPEVLPSRRLRRPGSLDSRSSAWPAWWNAKKPADARQSSVLRLRRSLLRSSVRVTLRKLIEN